VLCAQPASSSHRRPTTRSVTATIEDGATVGAEQVGETRRLTALVVGSLRSCRPLGTDWRGSRRRLSPSASDREKLDREENRL
jgi:hypothetical protein